MRWKEEKENDEEGRRGLKVEGRKQRCDENCGKKKTLRERRTKGRKKY